jgi:hypothetical protein
MDFRNLVNRDDHEGGKKGLTGVEAFGLLLTCGHIASSVASREQEILPQTSGRKVYELMAINISTPYKELIKTAPYAIDMRTVVK